MYIHHPHACFHLQAGVHDTGHSTLVGMLQKRHLSRRPGRSRAGSIRSGRLVAPIMYTPDTATKQTIPHHNTHASSLCSSYHAYTSKPPNKPFLTTTLTSHCLCSSYLVYIPHSHQTNRSSPQLTSHCLCSSYHVYTSQPPNKPFLTAT